MEHAAHLTPIEVANLADEVEHRIAQVLAFRPRLNLVPPGVLPEAGVTKTALVKRPS